jgi:mannuronan 5-epimerase
MANTKSLLLIFTITSLLVIGTNIDALQPYAEGSSGQQQKTPVKSSNACVKYDETKRLITVSCKTTTLSDIYNQINNSDVLSKQQQGVWLLNANVTIEKGSTLTIDPKDTTWLKILADEKTLAYGIHVHGSLKIDSVKVTSWDPLTNHYALSHGSRESSGSATEACGYHCSVAQKDLLTHHGSPRPYLRVEADANGTTNITNSYIGYLGYEGGWGAKTSGLHYNAGDGSVLKNNDIDNLYFGFYSVGIGHIVIENNTIHNSGHYGIDPHTGTHDMIIGHNTVYKNNGTAIICSVDCYNIMFENNHVYDNNGAGISFSRNTTQSVAKNNYIHNQTNPLEIANSHKNDVYNNLISGNVTTTKAGITLKGNSTENYIHNNTIINSQSGMLIRDTSLNNQIYSNNIINTDANLTGFDVKQKITYSNAKGNANQIINK